MSSLCLSKVFYGIGVGCVMLAAVALHAQDPVPAGKAVDPVVVMTTSLGVIEVQLYPKKAPITVKNFLRYVDDKFYDGLIFHRVIRDYIVQGGGLDEKMRRRKTRGMIRNEACTALKNEKGTIAMARMTAPDSAICDFFFNMKTNRALDYRPGNAGYCAFGRVLKGQEVLEAIAKEPVGSSGSDRHVPVRPIVIKSIRRKVVEGNGSSEQEKER